MMRSTFCSQNAQAISFSEHFWKLRCWTCVRSCGAKHMAKSKLMWREAQNVQRTPFSERFGSLKRPFCVVGVRDSAPCQKWTNYEGFGAASNMFASMGHSKRIWKDASRVAGTVQETHESDILGGPGADFLGEFNLEIQIISASLLRSFCVTGAGLCMWPGLTFFRGRRNTLDRWNGKNAKRIGTRSSDLHSTSHFWRCLAELLRFWLCQLENWGSFTELLQFDSVNFTNWGSIEKVLQFWCCELRHVRKSHRIAPFSNLQKDR